MDTSVRPPAGSKVPIVVVLAIMLLGLTVPALGVIPPAAEVSDTPDDWGTGLTVTWDRPAAGDGVTGYEIWRLKVEKGRKVTDPAFADTVPASDVLASAGWEMAGDADLEDTVWVDSGLETGQEYTYVVVALTGGPQAPSPPTSPETPRRQIIRNQRINILVAVALFMLTVVVLVERARRGAKLFIRRIAGLEAVEEAVGRSTEMGRPILYVPGLDPMDEVGTVAAINILGQVAKKAGEYDTRLIVPNRDPIVMAVAQQVVRESYSAVGKPHLYRDEDVYYVTFSQFGFAAAVAGLMMRERPATNFFIGRFYAESLVLAETGNATGAIQIAGTDSDAQLPFFISACDYTLMGEELYAGSVYLSREPLLLGALKSQDYAKALIIIAIFIGIVLYIVSPDVAEQFKAVFN
ncbi:MAG: fibronectin type III domain-containing protein [Candidatus Eisenbacteria bacterium]